MHLPAPPSRVRAPVLAALFGVAIWIAACSDPTGPRPTPPDGLRPSALVNNPDSGCWVAQNPALFSSGPDEGGSPPWTYRVCGVYFTVSWPGWIPNDGWTETNVRNGAHQYPWANTVGALGTIAFTGWPWTVSFDSRVKNVRVYTRMAEHPGGKVVLKNGAGAVIAEKPIPISPTTTTGLDTIAFTDTGVVKVEIIPAPDPTLSNAPEKIMWSAQFEGTPQQLCELPIGTGQDTVGRRAFNTRAVREEMERMLGRSDTTLPIANRHEEVVFGFKNVDGSFRLERPPFTVISNCSSQFTVPLTDSTLAFVIHTHPYRHGASPECPGLAGVKYEPDMSNPGSKDDYTFKNISNAVRGLNFGSRGFIPWFIIDLDFAWYLPWDSQKEDTFLPPRIGRRAGQSGVGCQYL